MAIRAGIPARRISRVRQGAARHAHDPSFESRKRRGHRRGCIVGAACAHRLQSLGFEVVLIDRGPPGEALFLRQRRPDRGLSLVTPKSVPGLLRKVPGMLLDRRHPLKTSAGFVLRNLPWCMRFARAGAPGEGRPTSPMHCMSSSRAADAAIDRMVASVGAADVIRTDGVLYVYQDPDLGEAARESMAESDRRGAPTRYVSGDQVRDIDPAIPASVTCGFHKPEERFVRMSDRAHSKGRAGICQGPAASSCATRSFGSKRAGDALRACTAARKATRRTRSSSRPAPGRRGSPRNSGSASWSFPSAATTRVLPRAGVGLKTAVHYGDRLVSMSPMSDGLRVSSGAELADVDAGAELETPRRGDRSGESALPESGRRRGDPVDGSPTLDAGLPARRRRAPGTPRRTVRYRARDTGAHPLGAHGGDCRRSCGRKAARFRSGAVWAGSILTSRSAPRFRGRHQNDRGHHDRHVLQMTPHPGSGVSEGMRRIMIRRLPVRPTIA